MANSAILTISIRRVTDKAGVNEVIALIREKAIIVTKDHYKTDKITTDFSDNKFLACALEAEADYIVSGDNHLLEIKHFQKIQIVDANAFVKKFKSH
jgi:uncharacterized protein